MEINTREANGVVVVDLVGKLDTQTSAMASDSLTKIAEGDNAKILVNLENLEFISSSGLRVLLRAAKQVKATEGAIKVCTATGVVKEVMEISGFDGLLDMHESESDALASF